MSRLGSARLLLTLFLPLLGCGRSPVSPAQNPAPQGTGAAPLAAVAVTIDSTGAREAIAGVSEVTIDASASTGSAFRYRVEFGDGAVSADRTARHIYPVPGNYKVTVSVTDDAGRTATTSSEVTVASLLGRFVHAGYFARANRVGVWLLTITSQDGGTVRGALTEDNADRGTVTGSISADRRLRLVLDRSGESLEGTIPSSFSADGSTLGVTVHGGSSNGETLSLKRAIGEPTGPPPDAVLKMRFFSFGAPFAVKQISPVLFDGSTSRGDGLSYFIEFGDGQTTTGASTTHPLDREGSYTARLTVIDRFGRSNSETNEYSAISLVLNARYYEWDGGVYFGATPCYCPSRVWITSQNGTSVTGTWFRDTTPNGATGPFDNLPFKGVVDGSGAVRFDLDNGESVLTGTMTLRSLTADGLNTLVLKVSGGPLDGATLSHYRRIGY
jgi:PKD repeat protein